MAIVINGSGTVTGLSVGGLPDGTVDEGTLATDSVTAAKIPASLENTFVSGRKNIFINGDFSVNQRGLTTSAVTATNGAYNIDRLANYIVGVGAQVALGSEELIGGTYETPVKYTVNSAASGRLGALQKVEKWYKGQTVIMSAWVKSNNANARLRIYDGSNEFYSSTHTGGGAWEKLTATGTLATNAGQLYCYLFIVDGSGGSVTLTTNDYIHIAKYQLELGSTATDFEHRSYGEELALCQRYFQTISFRSAWGSGVGKVRSSSGTAFTMVKFLNTMRVLPSTITAPTVGQSSGNITYLNGENWPSTHGSLNATEASVDSCFFNLTGFSNIGSIGDATWAYVNGTAIFYFDSEL